MINPTITATYLLGSFIFIAHQQKDERPRADERRKGTRELLGE
ncbi:MAG: hypothetical protein AB4368_02460 [Xenococcaceae cyanobacterium]